MKRQGYRAAVQWLADNDDCEWLDEDDAAPSVSTCLVADIFGVDTDRVTTDLRRRRQEGRDDE